MRPLPVKKTLTRFDDFLGERKGTLNVDLFGLERCRQLISLSEFYISPNRCLHSKASFTEELFLPFTTF